MQVDLIPRSIKNQTHSGSANCLSCTVYLRRTYKPDFYTKPTKKWPQSLDTGGIAVFLFCHKYVVENLIFWLEPKFFYIPKTKSFTGRPARAFYLLKTRWILMPFKPKRPCSQPGCPKLTGCRSQISTAFALENGRLPSRAKITVQTGD